MLSALMNFFFAFSTAGHDDVALRFECGCNSPRLAMLDFDIYIFALLSWIPTNHRFS